MLGDSAVEQIARAVAVRLIREHGPRVVTDVERAIHPEHPQSSPERYLDPVSLGGLIVSIAGLTWTVYTDLRRRTGHAERSMVSRDVRVRIHETGVEVTPDVDRIIDVAVEETASRGDRQDDDIS